MIEAAGLAATEGYRVPTVAQHVAVHDDRAIASAGNRERVCERGVRRVFYGEIFQNKIVCVIQIPSAWKRKPSDSRLRLRPYDSWLVRHTTVRGRG